MSTAQNTQPKTAKSSRRVWIAGAVVGVLILVALAYVAFSMMRMSDVPANLDYSTTRTSAQGLYRATIKPEMSPIPINRLHTWVLHVETPDGKPIENAQVSVNGDMPQHGHGLPTKPQVTGYLGGGDYRVEGMKFQMGGWWVIDFTVDQGGKTDKVSFNLMLN